MADKQIRFTCPYCGQLANVVWRADGGSRELVRLFDGFHVEEQRSPERSM